MAKKSDARTLVGLKCTKCNYMIRHTEKNTKNTTEKLENPNLADYLNSLYSESIN